MAWSGRRGEALIGLVGHDLADVALSDKAMACTADMDG
jgi:hypothetical protein